MKFAIVVSKKDIAGMNITSHINGLPIYYTEKDIIYAENIDKEVGEDFIVFASLHKSKEERKTLSLHAPGNWRKADYGGKPENVCPTSAFVLKYLFQELNKNNTSDYQVTLECTHHGPYIEKPCCFIEIGSGEEQWKDQEAGKIIAKTISSLKNFKSRNWISAIGIGGPHYCPNFNKIQLNSNYAIGHIIPSYALPLTESMLKQAIEKTKEKVKLALLDWKGLGRGKERKESIKTTKQTDLRFKRTSEVEK